MAHTISQRLGRGLLVLLFLAAILGVTQPAAAAGLSDDNKLLLSKLSAVETAVNAGKYDEATTAYTQLEDSWYSVEDDIKAASKEQYRSIETSMAQIHDALKAKDSKQTVEGIEAIETSLSKLTPPAAASNAPASAASQASLNTFVSELAEAKAAIARKDATVAASIVGRLNTLWVDVEGAVKTRNLAAYSQTERNLAEAVTALKGDTPDFAAADKAIGEMQASLTPIAAAVSSGSNYGPFDAGIILLREGFEALLVVIALTAFLKKSGNQDKRAWIWGGGVVGILASIVTAFIFQVVFGNVANGGNRELIEGIVGLTAAAMLFYVSYWLHSKSSAASWQSYIRQRSTAALASGSLFSLATLAFLAVYREGAETTLFYLGMAPSISVSDLLLGLVGGIIALALLGLLMTVVGLRIPIHTFFLVSSLLIYYIGFKFVGTGVHSLQVAGVLPATALPALPQLDWLGFYPTLETIIAQSLLLVIGIAVWAYSTRKQIILSRQLKVSAQH